MAEHLALHKTKAHIAVNYLGSGYLNDATTNHGATPGEGRRSATCMQWFNSTMASTI